MAVNTYKSETKSKKRKPKKKKVNLGFNFSFIKDRRFHLAFGFFLIIGAFFLLIAFASYFFSGNADQSVLNSVSEEGLKSSGRETKNLLGLLGAYLSRLFIYEWFGIASFLIPPLLFILGSKIVLRKAFVSVRKTFRFVFFFLFWISLCVGYIFSVTDSLDSWSFLSGGIGYQLAILSKSLIGGGTILFLIFSLAVFIVYFFNVTEWFSFVSVSAEKLEKKERSPIKVPNPEPKKEEGERLSENQQKEGSNLSSLNKEDLVSNPSDLNLEEPINFDIPSTAPKRKSSQKDMEFVIEDTTELLNEEENEALDFTVSQQVKEETQTGIAENYDPTLDLGSYQFPSDDLLIDYGPGKVKVSQEELQANKDKIVETLVNFKIGISSIKATIGPTVTLYEIVPEAGVKISKIKNLEDDIALSLAALGIRIIAPIPGKGTIGIEVPNKNKEMVSIRSVISTEKFMKSESELPVVLGKTISNEVFVADLAKMPHLLMAGATGQGKSVGLNTILTSLIYKKHPSQLKFVLVDPKKVELTLFNKIERHFLARLPNTEESIITDTKKVIHTLNSLCMEMDNRYDLLKDAGCRNIKEYNVKFVKRRLNPEKGHRFLPYIVLVIDELADLMMTAGKEVETPIARLAQLARAIGIHLIIATQRPSVNVITGIIKANFPARISFRVTSKIDSRTILDAGGAEQLIGQGDMLLSQGSDIIRLQCAFVDTPEVEGICEFVGSQRGYESAYLLPEVADEDGDGAKDVDLSDRDSLFEDAARLIVTHQQGSTSLIQRKLKLGYNRAGRLIDQLEAAGIVGPFEGSKAREVLIQDEYSLEQLLNEL
ncbi:FtsK/SpoIIIE family DNA translocase [Xanthovirga aplysinae]|uniref:FtsK/SpoIIIE family DNA translocase n=1 Tax=Xanthovirga aplysinae TaxID=2529853 RepID=UPI0012BCC7C3|nr:DNA translocase FtsK [Xanthovirga aplysinae]MTI31035.1 DNA translocase FtsK [Xanthovirga aplysinae]